MSLENFGYKQELKRSLTFWDLLIYGMIFMVPIAPFGVFGYVYDTANGMVALAYLIGMVGMVFTAFSYARMSEAFPISGSVYAYAQRGINRHVGFIAGWAILLDYILVPSLLYLVSSAALQALIPSIPIWVWLIIFIVINTAINIRGIEFTARANKIILFAQLIVLLVFIIAGLVALFGGAGAGHLTADPLYNADSFSMPLVIGAVSTAVLSFLGFDGISTLSEEVKDGQKAIGKATITALIVIGSLFIIQTWIASDLAQGTVFSNLDTAFYDIAGTTVGPWLKNTTILATAISWGIANSLAAQAAVSRILFSMGRDGNIPTVFAKVHTKYKTPYVSTTIVAVLSLVVGLAFQTKIDTLTNIINFGALAGFLLLHVSVVNHYVIRNKSKQWWKHLIFPIIGFAIISYVMWGMDTQAITIGLCWIVIGILYHLIMRKVFKKSGTLNV